MFSVIVVGLDGSDASKSALTLACDLAGKYGSELHLIHTPQPETVAFAMGSVAGYHAVTTMPSQEDVAAAADHILSEGAKIVADAGLDVSQSHVGHGHPADEAVDFAGRVGADLIVTGRRGLGSIGAMVQGSTSQRIGHLAKCAVLTTA